MKKVVLYFILLAMVFVGSSTLGCHGSNNPDSIIRDTISEAPCSKTCLKSFLDIINCNTNKMVIEQVIEDKSHGKGLRILIDKLFSRN